MKKRYVFQTLLLICLTACGSKDEFDATGTFEATEIVVSSEATGKLFYLNAEEGMHFTQGSEVGLIDTVQLYLKKRQLEAQMKSVESQRPDIHRQIAATKAQAANRKQLDDWDSQLAVLNRQLEAQLSSLGNTTASLTEQSSSVAIQVAQVEDQLKKCHITVPINGTILAKYAEPSELATVGKPLFKIADMEHIFLRAYLTSSQLESVKLGNEVTVFADFGNAQLRNYTGKIVWISEEAEFTPKTILTNDERANQVYAVKIAVENDGHIKLGMYGKVKF